MSMDIEEAEVLFAQKLADCEPDIRRKAFSRLQHWITSRMKSKNGFTRLELITLWKGLYYCMWMQDKPLLQEELTDRLCAIGDIFSKDDQHILYLDTFFETVGREWNHLDRWRVDKFMLLFRRMFRHMLAWLKSRNWDEEIWNRFSQLFTKTVWAVDSDPYPEELKCHFVSIYLDELDFAGAFKLPQEKTFQLLLIYIKLMTEKISDALSQCIQKEIFKAILIDYSENGCPKKESRHRKRLAARLPEPAGSSDSLQLDYGAVADALTEAGRSKELGKTKRAVLYDFAKQFRIAASGQDPLIRSIEIPDDIDDEEVEKAAIELLKESKQQKKKRKRGTKEKRATAKEHDLSIERKSKGIKKSKAKAKITGSSKRRREISKKSS